MNICVFAGTAAGNNPAFEIAAASLGREIALRGHTLVFGGGANGLMGACARAVRENGGDVIGVAPRFFDRAGVLFSDCTELVFTDTIRERKQLMEERSGAFAALPGGIGTFEEFFEIITLRQLGRHEKRAAVFNVDSYYSTLEALVLSASDNGFLKRPKDEIYRAFDSAALLVDYLEGK